MAAVATTEDFFQQRQDKLKQKDEKLKQLAIDAAASALAKDAALKAKGVQRVKRARAQASPVDETEVRRSGRERGEVNYKEQDMLGELKGIGRRGGGKSGGSRAPRELDEEEIKRLREEHGVREDAEPAHEGRRGIDSGKGVRIQGGKVYDSKLGRTCHWCRQKTIEDSITCTSATCGKGGKKMPTTFCGACLRNRNGEDWAAALASGSWVCPPCRGTCGEGCTSCCNCGPCRKKLGMEPTGQVMGVARSAGYNNVHDYLVSLTTKQDQEELSTRKHGFPWGQWLLNKGETVMAKEAKTLRAAAAEAAAAAEEALNAAAAMQLEQTLVDAGAGDVVEDLRAALAQGGKKTKAKTRTAKRTAGDAAEESKEPPAKKPRGRAGKAAKAAANSTPKAAGLQREGSADRPSTPPAAEPQSTRQVGAKARFAEMNRLADLREAAAAKEATGALKVDTVGSKGADAEGDEWKLPAVFEGVNLTRKQRVMLEMKLITTAELMAKLGLTQPETQTQPSVGVA